MLARVIHPAARWILGAALLAALPGEASAEAPPEVRATAEKLYQDAYALSLDGQHARACKLYEESDRLDPANGTKLELAKCYEKTLRPASAWALYVMVADGDKMTGKNWPREAQARSRARALEATLPRLVVVVPESARRKPGLRITRDGVPVGEALWGTAMPVDLGKHAILASAPDNLVWEGEALVSRMGETVTVTIPEVSAFHEGEMAGEGGAAPIAALTFAGVGIAGLVVGGVFGGLAFAKWGEVEAMAQGQCHDPSGLSGCTIAVAEKGTEASRYATASTAGFVVGGVGLAAGAALWLVASKGKQPTPAQIEVLPAMGREGVGAVVRGSF
ncbi:hypothetical protein [Polyangium aurulentum]|uniref:hypothetical protein n=1 Tax=Polyangium aurulentum TaxID=2567896 RepID=UPI0010ADDB6C|nr:hypothetical protein [Polyangium aurulentum]UQA55237.1 hypothetical protein E8A73_028280 [Polyangium aurulentum]